MFLNGGQDEFPGYSMRIIVDILPSYLNIINVILYVAPDFIIQHKRDFQWIKNIRQQGEQQSISS